MVFFYLNVGRNIWFFVLQCEVIHGFGFRRGGYQCVCKPGYYYPWWHDGPFLGLEIEQATGAEYDVGFECLQVEGISFILFLFSGENEYLISRQNLCSFSIYVLIIHVYKL